MHVRRLVDWWVSSGAVMPSQVLHADNHATCIYYSAMVLGQMSRRGAGYSGKQGVVRGHGMALPHRSPLLPHQIPNAPGELPWNAH